MAKREGHGNSFVGTTPNVAFPGINAAFFVGGGVDYQPPGSLNTTSLRPAISWGF